MCRLFSTILIWFILIHLFEKVKYHPRDSVKCCRNVDTKMLRK